MARVPGYVLSAGLAARLVTIGTGVWLMAAPAVLHYGDPAAASDRVVGPLAISVGLVALWEALRPVRWAGAGMGVWALAAPWLLGFGGAALASGSAAGIVLIACAFGRGSVEQRIGGGWQAILAPDRTWEGSTESSETGGGS